MQRPTFFLSSTIYDFKDLRSSVKYLLEQQGCSVLASEYNDFPKPLEAHSYEACIETLKKADYFVLFIGTRVGGWYDKTAKISITQQEYREAYKLHLEGKLKLISFVRADIWKFREDRNELSKFLDTIDIDPGAREAIRNYPSKSASDAEFICSFVGEVCRNEETKAALDGKAPMPTGNWIHVFDTFRDVADVLQTQAFSGLPVEQVALRRLLLRELLEVLRSSLAKFKEGQVYSPASSVERFYSTHSIEPDCRKGRDFVVDTKLWDILCSLSIQLIGIKYNTMILQRALESTTFLTYDLASGNYLEDPVYDALHQLYEQIQLVNMANTVETMGVVFKHTPRVRLSEAQTIRIQTPELLNFLSLLDRWVNVIELSRAIIKHLRGGPFVMPSLRPRSPIPAMNEQLNAERVSIDDVDRFLSENP